MESVTRFWSHEAQNIRCVREADFDRVSAENLALKEELERQKRYVEINANSAHGKHLEGQRYRDERDALQQRLTVQDQLVDDLKGLLRRAKPYIPWSNFGTVPYQWNLEVQDALNHTAEAESHEKP